VTLASLRLRASAVLPVKQVWLFVIVGQLKQTGCIAKVKEGEEVYCSAGRIATLPLTLPLTLSLFSLFPLLFSQPSTPSLPAATLMLHKGVHSSGAGNGKLVDKVA